MTTTVCAAPTLRTTRLQMRALTPADTDALFETVGRADVMEHYVDLADHTVGWSRTKTAEFIDGCGESWTVHGYGRWGLVLADTGRLVGYCGLNRLDYLPAVEPAVELSFRLHPDVWGAGLAGEAARAGLGWAFADLGVDSVVACTVPGNRKSVRALEKLSFVYEVTLPYHSPVSGVDALFAVYRINRPVKVTGGCDWRHRSS